MANTTNVASTSQTVSREDFVKRGMSFLLLSETEVVGLTEHSRSSVLHLSEFDLNLLLTADRFGRAGHSLLARMDHRPMELAGQQFPRDAMFMAIDSPGPARRIDSYRG